MALEQDFLPFATGAGANVLTQSAYAALAALSTGYQSGVANSAQLNKTWRQSSIAAAILAQFIVNNSGQPAIDDGTTATLLTNLATAVSVCARQNPVLTDTGTANAYAVANAAAFTAYPTVSGLVIDVSIAHTNTSAATLNVDGLGTKPIYGLGLQALQGGELPANGVASLMYVVAPSVNSGNGAWVILECTGGAQQIAPATQSQHAMQLGQAVGRLLNIQTFSTSGTYTPTPGTNKIIVRGIGGGGGGGGAGATTSSQAAVATGGGSGSFGEIFFTGTIAAQTVTIGTPGSGGAAGANAGTAGGGTIFGTLATFPGGNGGAAGVAATPPFLNTNVPAAPGAVTTTGTIINIQRGGVPGPGIALSILSAIGGSGATGPLGQGGNGNAGGAGNAATGLGAGGGGAGGGATLAASAGGAGSVGGLIIFEYS